MLAFTLDPGRWWIARPLGRNPLLRAADRLEALLILVVIVGWLLVVPIAGAIGTAIYDGRHRLYAEEALTRHRVVATVIEDTAETVGDYDGPASVRAVWPASGGERTGSFSVDTAAKSGDRLSIWVDADGNYLLPPTPIAQAAADALCGALSILLSAIVVTALAVSLMRYCANRMRDTQWERELRAIKDDRGPRRGKQY
jgi:hypothetical protein